MQEVDADLTALDRAIINAFQGGFPVAERPFDAAAAALRERGVDVTGPELCERVRELDEEGILSRFGALVNAEEIGGAASLVAMHAPEDRYEEIAETVNEFTAVAHNYEREHPHLNMWFVVSVADHPDPDKDGSDRVEEVLSEIEAATGQETYNLPKLREFHVGAKFLVDGPVPEGDVDLSELGPEVAPSGRGTLTPDERDLVVEIQGGLPVTETPYADVAAAIGADVDWVIETIKRFEREGKVRRVGVIPNHYALGYTENGMTVWNVPEEVLDEVGPAVAALDFVTHCYERPRHAGVWEYNFFAMTHGRTEAESERRIAEVRELMDEHWDVGADDWDTLFSTRILKKTGIRIADRADSNTA
ncbi:Lrp/AsnC family transcriptional regulator [Halorubrum distributum]|uniref:siroheme decarboxylase n=1 Tax=Halorubrum distributum TaxID=29283 RepID=A0A6B1I962_9EURY|nr:MULTISPECIES: Lrp/AsnC family transcriptional regulator [Halorubrum distributum group]MDV7348189.1 Lrp/AsnC family transcriptional regulator [Halorubrum distributum]MYL15271.1 Lrp/AsnC family transcriptional regulator [Halorubrum terrestre]